MEKTTLINKNKKLFNFFESTIASKNLAKKTITSIFLNKIVVAFIVLTFILSFSSLRAQTCSVNANITNATPIALGYAVLWAIENPNTQHNSNIVDANKATPTISQKLNLIIFLI